MVTAVQVEVEAWCLRALGTGTLLRVNSEAGGQMSHLFRFDSDERGPCAVKVRRESWKRISRCLQLQTMAADAGFACARPMTSWAGSSSGWSLAPSLGDPAVKRT